MSAIGFELQEAPPATAARRIVRPRSQRTMDARRGRPGIRQPMRSKDAAEAEALPWACFVPDACWELDAKHAGSMKKTGSPAGNTASGAGRLNQSQAMIIAGYAPIAPNMELKRVRTGTGPNGQAYYSLGLNDDGSLMTMPDGINGIEPFPVYLTEETANGVHISKHAEQLVGAGYESPIHAILDIAENWARIYDVNKNGEKGKLMLERPIIFREDEKLKHAVLHVSLRKTDGFYRVNTVFIVSDSKNYVQNKTLLLDRSHPSHGTPPAINSSEAEIPPSASLGCNSVSLLNRIGKEATEVNAASGEPYNQALLSHKGDVRAEHEGMGKPMKAPDGKPMKAAED